MDNEGFKSNVQFDNPIAVRSSNDRAPAIPEVSTHIAEEVEALHHMIGELFDTLEFILTPETDSKDNVSVDRPAMSDLGQRLMRSRDGIHYACDRLRDLRMRIDL